jgi:hypothetical protein
MNTLVIIVSLSAALVAALALGGAAMRSAEHIYLSLARVLRPHIEASHGCPRSLLQQWLEL